jgi:uncharacterized protein YjiS (DUF1127 family)
MIKRLIQRMRHHRLRVQASKQLHALSDHQLRDIGLIRGLIDESI